MGILTWPKKTLDRMPEMRWKKRVLYSLLILGYLVGVVVGMIILLPLAWIFDKIYEQF